MEVYMEFFVKNWFWFLVGGVIILMTLIGYIAEKTDFGRKDIPKTAKKPKINKEEKKKLKTNQQLTDTLEAEEPKPEVQMSLATDSILTEPADGNLENNTMDTTEDLNVPFGDTNFEEPIGAAEEVVENLNMEPNANFNSAVIEEPVNEVIKEDLSAPFGDINFEEPNGTVEEVVAEEPVEELKLQDVSTPEIELPDLDSIVTAEDDNDDVWKF